MATCCGRCSRCRSRSTIGLGGVAVCRPGQLRQPGAVGAEGRIRLRGRHQDGRAVLESGLFVAGPRSWCPRWVSRTSRRCVAGGSTATRDSSACRPSTATGSMPTRAVPRWTKSVRDIPPRRRPNACSLDVCRRRESNPLDPRRPGFSGCRAPRTVSSISAPTTGISAYADTSILPAVSSVCSYPGLPADLSCSSAGFQPIGVPQLKSVAITGSVPVSRRSRTARSTWRRPPAISSTPPDETQP